MSKKKSRGQPLTFWRHVRNFFIPYQVDGRWFVDMPTARERAMREYGLGPIDLGQLSDEEIHRRNARRFEFERMELDRDVANKNLKAQHKAMIVTLIAALIALISSGAAVFTSLQNKPPVVQVNPNIIIEK